MKKCIWMSVFLTLFLLKLVIVECQDTQPESKESFSRILQSQPTCFETLRSEGTASSAPSSRTTRTSPILLQSSPILGSAASQPEDELTYSTKYEDFISSYNPMQAPEFGSSHYSYRSLVYQSNLQKIMNHNRSPNVTFKMGVNSFCDLTQKQFNEIFTRLIIPEQVKKVTFGLREKIKNSIITNLGPEYSRLWTDTLSPGNYPAFNLAKSLKSKNLRTAETLPNRPSATSMTGNGIQSPILGGGSSTLLNAFATLTIPSTPTTTQASYTTPERISIDWSCKSSQIINQGVCGSCFVIAPLESIYMTLRIYNQSILPLSIQEVLSCTGPSEGAFGCGGGYFLSAFQYVKDKGAGRALMYPYNSRATNQGVVTPCNQTLVRAEGYASGKFRLRDFGFIPYNDCAELIQRLKIQPIAVSISTTNFQFYTSGTYNANGEMPNHGVVLVGYHPDRGYKIKNSWGNAWGDAGYGWVSEGTGVCDYSMYPITGFQGTGSWECC